MTNLIEKQVEEIESFSREIYLSLDDTHDLDHARKTEKLAMYLASLEGADVQICRLGALLHQYHPNRAGEVDLFLKGIGVEDSLRESLVHCVKCVELDTIHEAETIEAKIVFDADKLQTLGPYGFIREVVYRTRHKDITFMEAFEQAKELQELVRISLQTTTAKKIYGQIDELTQGVIKSVDEWNTLSFIE